MVEIVKHKKEFLCPEHYKLMNPPEAQETLECSFCFRPLEYICPTCQSYVDEQKKQYDILDNLKEQIKLENKPIPTMAHPVKKTLAEWKDYEDGQFLRSRLDEEGAYERLNKIPELDKSKKYPWEYLWYILVNGYEAFVKWLSKKEKAEKEFEGEWKKKLEERKAEEKARKQQQEEEKRRREERDKKVIEIKEQTDAIKTKLKNYLNMVFGSLNTDIAKIPIEKRIIPQKIVNLIKQFTNLISSKKEEIEFADFSKFYEDLRGDKSSSILNTNELKTQYVKLLENFDSLFTEWEKLKGDLDLLYEEERSKFAVLDDGKNWKDISPNFDNDLKKKWIENGFNYQQVQEWIGAGLNSQDANFAKWLRDDKSYTADYVLNYENLEDLIYEFNNTIFI